VLYSDYEPGAGEPSLFAGENGSEQLLSAAGGFTDVAISPDGERVAFVRLISVEGEADIEATADPSDAVPSSLPQLVVAPLSNLEETSVLTQMTGTSIAYPSWSPDGETIVFASNQDGDEELYIISSGGGNLRQLTDNLMIDTAPKFSPDGNLIAYTSDAETPGFTEIYTYSLEDGTITRLTDENGNNYAPAWSPDGSRIAYLSTKQGDGDVYVMDADGSRSFQITPDDDGAEDRSPVWSPDGRWIVFASNREAGTFRWFAVNVETRETIQLTDNQRTAQSLVFQPR
jgi:tol-pal system beta propeller repeat protein TolB